MSAFPWMAAAGGLSALSGAASASAGRTAANEARDLNLNQANQNQLNLGQLMYGPGYGTNYQYMLSGGAAGGAGGYGGGYTGSQFGGGGNQGAPWSGGGQNAGGMDKWTIRSVYPRDANGNITYSGGSLLGQVAGIGQEAMGRNAATLSGYNTDTARLGNLALGAEGMAGQWGRGQRDMIGGDFARDLNNANSMSRASLSAAGLGNSTIGASQMRANTTQNSRERQRAMQNLADQQIDRQLGARTQRLSVEGGRASGRTGLEQSITGQNAAYQRAPLDLMLQTQMSNIMNPGLGANSTAYTSGQSGWGNALGSLGAGLGTYGGYQLGQQNQTAGIQQLLDAMRRSGGGGSTDPSGLNGMGY